MTVALRTGRPPRDVAIVGAGLAGSLLACFLARRGHAVTLYERRADPRASSAERGRSINLAISERGIDALRRLGLEADVLCDALPMSGRVVHAVDGTLARHSYSADGTRAINSIERACLNETLLDAAESHPEVRVRFEHRLMGLDPAGPTMRFDTPVGPAEHAARIVIGADGAFSAVRERLQHQEGFDYSQAFLPYAYKELHIEPQGGDFAFDPTGLHIWPRTRELMIALPNPDRSFTCTLFGPRTGPVSFAAMGTPARVSEHFERHYPDAAALMPDLAERFAANPLGALVTIRCQPWGIGDRVVLIGDAAHAMVPFYGQGANCAFEDCVALDRALEETGDDWAPALERYYARRKPNADCIADLALQNFIEMRDLMSQPWFRARRRLEHALERRLDGHYVSLYELVSFSTVPYESARRRVERQQAGLRASAVAAGLGALAAATWAGTRR
jgi:kynurenine 3-monooxygenase